MGFFDKIFNKKKDEKAVANDLCINIQRNDGSILRIKPVIDKEGNHMCKAIQDEYGNLIANIPQYLVYEQQEKGKIVGHYVYMEVAKEYLNVPYYADYIANDLLSEKRLHDKVLDNYHGYAGFFDLDENGQITGRNIRSEIIEALNVEKINEHNDRIRSEEERAESLRNEIRGKDTHIKDSHAEQLSPDMMPDWMREGYSRSERNNRNTGMDR